MAARRAPARRTTSSRARSTARCWPARSSTPSSGKPRRRVSRPLTRPSSCSAENARLERGLLPAPGAQGSAAFRHDELPTRPCRRARRRLLRRRGDRRRPAALLIGDVSGHGPDEAALGVCLRIAWRTLVLSGFDPPCLLPVLEEMLSASGGARRSSRPSAAGRRRRRGSAALFLAGHPAPILLEPRVRAAGRRNGSRSSARRRSRLGLGPRRCAAADPLGARCCYTDGLFEGFDETGDGESGVKPRLGLSGLLDIIAGARAAHLDDGTLLDR